MQQEQKYAFDVCKRKAKCRGHECQEAIPKGCLRVRCIEQSKPYVGALETKVYDQCHYFHLPCWHSSKIKPADLDLKSYNGFRLLPNEIQIAVLASTADSDKFIAAGPQAKHIPPQKQKRSFQSPLSSPSDPLSPKRKKESG